MQLFGVILGSAQGGLGEASCLAMAAFYDSRTVITFWSSGTGFAGEHSRSSPSLSPNEGFFLSQLAPIEAFALHIVNGRPLTRLMPESKSLGSW